MFPTHTSPSKANFSNPWQIVADSHTFVTIRAVVPYLLVNNDKSEDVVLIFILVVPKMTRTLLTLADRRLTLNVQT